MRPPHAAIAVVALLLLVPVFAPAPAAAPPPEGVCGVCGPGFERAAEDAGVNVTVAESQLVVRVDDDGDSRWTATVEVNPEAADEFTTNHSLLDRVVRATFDSSRTVVDEPRDLTAQVHDRTLVIQWTVPDAAHRRTGDVLLFDVFTQDQGEGEAYVDADRVAVRGPEHRVVTHAPDGGTIRGSIVSWADTDAGSYHPDLGRHATIAFAPDGGLVAQTATALAVRGHSLAMVEPDLRAYAQWPALLLGLVATGLLLAGGHLTFEDGAARRVVYAILATAGCLVTLGAGGALLGGEWGELAFVFALESVGLAPAAVLTAAIVTLAERVDPDPGPRATTVAAIVAVGWPLVLVLGAPGSAVLVLLLGPLAFLAYGVLAGAGHPARWLFPPVAALGAVVAALPFVPRIGVVFVTPGLFAALLVGSALLGVPLFALGRCLGGQRTAHPDGPDGSRTTSV
ncbi:hypothetical protein [Haloarchaeobius sp. HME9146]|uniref:hypothetical protein n=1 Tax=Haloarchaeobius sp. HME9146 TaxID=2978732 RepID=UPI0021C0D47D|nr:hypothetical protein [Haloarchaeobius sp. HME9146]MCT9096191.1 hypothetical protein [Haloarchaeobius sp. HME9146]